MKCQKPLELRQCSIYDRKNIRRDGRVVDCACFESRRSVRGSAGSNPAPSAKIMVGWLSGRKRSLAKGMNGDPVPWVRIPPRPPYKDG